MKTYLCVYLGSVFLALVITPVVIRLARRLRTADSPGARAVHKKPVPRIGGVAIFVSMLCMTLPVLFLHNTVGQRFRGMQFKVITLLSAAAFIFVVGVIDDLRGLRARTKFLAQLVAAIAICAVGISIRSITFADWLTVDFGWFSWPFTLLWIIGITNAINFTDGLDGLAAGISALACGVIAILAVLSGQVVMAVLMLALLGSLTGFLFFNFNPAKIFMGDSGSMFLGFIIASSSVMCNTKSQTLVGLALPVLVLGIPIFDTLFSILRRFLERRSIFAADRSHFHHKLLDLGLKQRHAVIVIYALTLLTAGLGMFMMVTRNINSLVIFLCVLLLVIFIFNIVGSFRLRGTIFGLQKKYDLTRQRKKEKQSFEKVQLHFRQADTFGQWWQATCMAAEKMDFARLRLPMDGNNNPANTLTWYRNPGPVEPTGVVKMKIPIHAIKAGPECNLEVDVNVNGSLESAGRRAALFSRLLDENGIADLAKKRKSNPI